MRVAYLASEVTPLARTGLLADVARDLCHALRRLGHDVALFLPRYRIVDNASPALSEVGAAEIPLGAQSHRAQFFQTTLPGSDVPVYLIGNGYCFDRPGVYQERGQDYPDNLERFAFYCRGVLELLRLLDWRPDVVHGNDWQTALALVYLKTLYRDCPVFVRTRTLLTVHNLAFHGTFPRDRFPILGLDPALFGIQGFEFFGRVNLLKGGLLFADHVNTVSKQYAREICTESGGCGLDGVLRQRAGALSGILNGVDYTTWDPSSDATLAHRYSADDLTGKAACKAALQRTLGLAQSPRRPLVATIAPFDQGHGIDLMTKALPKLFNLGIQLVVVGGGDPALEQRFAAIRRDAPETVAVCAQDEDPVVRTVLAGSDMLLAPGLIEPSGRAQLFGLRYGTVPIVRKTGALADTVQNYGERSGKGNGFVFTKPMPGELVKAVRRAVTLYRKNPGMWRALAQRGMRLDFSWDASARAYEQLYRRLLRS